MASADESLTPAQQEFVETHAIGLVEESFALDTVFMYRNAATFTERWLVRSDGTPAQHDHFER